MPILMRLSPHLLARGGGSDDLADGGIVRGVIDVLWWTPEGVEIADFKTDAVEGAELRRRIDLYKDQTADVCRGDQADLEPAGREVVAGVSACASYRTIYAAGSGLTPDRAIQRGRFHATRTGRQTCQWHPTPKRSWR